MNPNPLPIRSFPLFLYPVTKILFILDNWEMNTLKKKKKTEMLKEGKHEQGSKTGSWERNPKKRRYMYMYS